MGLIRVACLLGVPCSALCLFVPGLLVVAWVTQPLGVIDGVWTA